MTKNEIGTARLVIAGHIHGMLLGNPALQAALAADDAHAPGYYAELALAHTDALIARVCGLRAVEPPPETD